MTKEKIYFFYPSKNVGGAQLLFVRIARYLSSDPTREIAVVDYENGFLQSQLQNDHQIKIVPFVQSVKIKLPPGSVVITPLSNMTELSSFFYLTAQNHLLFWSLQPKNLAAAFQYKGRNLFFQREKVSPLIQEMARNKSILFMDNPNYWGARDFLGQDFHFHFLPIPFEIAHTQDVCLPKAYNKINIAWLGRISYEKVSAILDIIEQIATLKNSFSKEIIFHVIGDGDRSAEVKSFADQCKITYTFAGALLNEELDKYIFHNVDLGVAMGTSCLEFAARKIPSVLLDYSYTKFTEKVKYRWLFETEGYALGQEIHLRNNRSHEFSEILNIFNDGPARRLEIADNCYNYVLKNHDIKNVVTALLEDIATIKEINSSWEIFNAINSYSNSSLYRYIYRPIFNLLLNIKNSFK